MSEPKRYAFKVNEENDFDLIEHSNGEFIHYEDYARLKAEVERLGWVSAGSVKFIDHTMELARQATRHHKEMERLKAEVERLTSIHSIDSIGIEQLKSEVERLKDALNKMTKTPDGVDYVVVDVSFWTKSGSRLPSSYSTFWSNDKGVQS